MNGLRELSNIHDLQLFAVECQINVKLTRYIGVGVIIFSINIPPISTVSPKVADNRGKTVYIHICVCVCVCVRACVRACVCWLFG